MVRRESHIVYDGIDLNRTARQIGTVPLGHSSPVLLIPLVISSLSVTRSEK